MVLDKGIPVPSKKRGKWDFLENMELGDSIITTTPQDYENARSAMRHRGMRYRSIKEPSGTGWRLWRVG